MQKVLITGGAGFLGSNLASSLCASCAVTVIDNFSRPGSRINEKWLADKGITIIEADIKTSNFFDPEQYDTIFHLAGQVTVTDSITDPRADFEHNVLGTINVLEAVRNSKSKPKVIFSSTNKVYGRISDARPITEDQPLDFLSPYGCSKGAADQYVLDYGRTYGFQAVVLRQSCIYGERQFGMLGQGWISWFALRILQGQPVTIFGDGKQSRDILHVSDWVRVAERAASQGSGVYNVGGGSKNAISIIEAVQLLQDRSGKKVDLKYDQARLGDQEYYVSDNSKAKRDLDWEPVVGITDGLESLVKWTEQII